MNSFQCGRYHHNMPLIFFTLKWDRDKGEFTPINRHMRGIVWLAWKFLWQQLAEIGSTGEGSFRKETALQGMFRMHHTAVLAAIYDYKIVQQDKRSGARKKCKQEQEEGETYRVWPYVEIDRERLKFRYTRTYHELLKRFDITPSEPPN